MKAEKEERFLAIIIPAKDVEGFFYEHPQHRSTLQKIEMDYEQFRKEKGKKPRNEYVIVNQDEPYIEDIWKTILEGEDVKRQRFRSR